MSVLFYYHDPMCSWCWGYRPTVGKLFQHLPVGLQRVNILGGLAPDSDRPMTEAMQRTIISHWRRIQSLLGTQFNFDFWTKCNPRRSTYPACRAVIAAASQGREAEMIEAIQHAYYLAARNPSDPATLYELAGEIGVDPDRFAIELSSAATEAELQRQIRFARNSPIAGFPSLVLKTEENLHALQLDYKDYRVTLADIARRLGGPALSEEETGSGRL